MQINEQLCDIFTRELCFKYSCEIVSKNDSWLKYIARYIDMFSNISADEFMNKYTTTIGSKIFMPAGYNRDWGFIKLLTHEVQHVADFAKNPQDMVMYCISKQTRAHIEMRAITTSFELEWWKNKRALSPRKYSRRLFDYGLEDKHVEYVEKGLTSASLSIQQGKIITPVGKNAIAILKRLFDSGNS